MHIVYSPVEPTQSPPGRMSEDELNRYLKKDTQVAITWRTRICLLPEGERAATTISLGSSAASSQATVPPAPPLPPPIERDRERARQYLTAHCERISEYIASFPHGVRPSARETKRINEARGRLRGRIHTMTTEILPEIESAEDRVALNRALKTASGTSFGLLQIACSTISATIRRNNQKF